MASDRMPLAGRAVTVGVAMALGYVGIYLCRKNLGVAIPMMIEAGFVPDKKTAGVIASYSTVAYMLGKFISGPLVDRLGGRSGLLASMGLVALFGALGGFAPGLWPLVLLYSLNRLAGAGAWNAIMKLASTWYAPGRLATAIGALSLSYVFGGAAAAAFGAFIASQWKDWHVVMSAPAAPLLLLTILCIAVVRQGPLNEVPADNVSTEGAASIPSRSTLTFGQKVLRLLSRPQFITICILSFALTLFREIFSTWSIDFLKSISADGKSVSTAALESTAYEFAGAIPILVMGYFYDRIGPGARRVVVVTILALLTLTLALLTTVSKGAPGLALPLLVACGLLLYGPYSILAGVVSVESGGTELAGTATGIADGIGYFASILAGSVVGEILDRAGYPVAFGLMSGLCAFATLAAAIGLRFRPAVVAAP